MRKITLVALFTAIGLTVSATPAIAAEGQTQAQAQTSAQKTQPNLNVTDKELVDFANAYESVNAIRQEAITRLNGDINQETAQMIQQQASEQMVKAVEDAGLSVENYNQIANALQNDVKLRERMAKLQ
ncbi:DUF4168 domain-containing protein [Photobacterium halotolerans]|uniref:DUF4168 domain-containing protein n=1 Tax=Photobacterium halotolerans TaxID=265726 RepID=UPI00042126A9|nr:DUF4168 domain-containing protein [Photobacterium halotolerans]